MADREFPEKTIAVDGGAVRAMRIGCSACQTAAYYQHLKGGKCRPPIAAAQHFIRAGWVVGSSHRKDLCPRHAKTTREKPMGDLIELKAEPPRQMTREDRRIINDRLDEVYGRDCYKQPWTDARVADDLGIPRQWVEEVRQQFFGEAGSNPLLDEYLNRADAFAANLTRFEALAGEAVRLGAELEGARVALAKQAEEISRLGKRIEKEIGR